MHPFDQKPQTLTNMTAIPHIDYRTIDLRSIKFELDDPIKGSNRRKIKTLDIDGQKVHYTPRFGTSFASIYGLSENIYNFFSHDEVINRIVEKTDKTKINVAMQLNENESHTILAASQMTRDVIKADDLYDLFVRSKFDHETIKYQNGVVISTHTPSLDRKFKVGGDELIDRFVIETPIDGFGDPSAYLGFLRLICSNGAIGYAKAFKSQIKMGTGKKAEGAIPTLNRFINTYRNEEGFSALHERLNSSITSWASLDELYRLFKLMSTMDMAPLHRNINKTGGNDEKAILIDEAHVKHGIYSSDLIERLRLLSGDAKAMYGLLSLDSMGEKQRRKVPTAATVYDLLNFATEIATHRAQEHLPLSRKLNAWVGQTIQGEYDLEGSKDAAEDATALFATAAASIPRIG